jgi:putative transposase
MLARASPVTFGRAVTTPVPSTTHTCGWLFANVERNPVRARMVAQPDHHPWSSATAHCGGADRHSLLHLDFWRTEWTAASWQDFLVDHPDQDAEAQRIRRTTHTGRPLGAPQFVRDMERTLQRILAPRKGGRPRKHRPDSAQQPLPFATLD